MRFSRVSASLFAACATVLSLSCGLLCAQAAPPAQPIQQEARTLLLIKPNAVAKGHIGAILARVEAAGLRIIGLRMQRLSKPQAEEFYAEHAGRPFFQSLVGFMTSAPLVAAALEGPDAVTRLRKLLGPTNPADALPGTIRADFGSSVQENAGHGSDSPTSAARELKLFFPDLS